jgi:tyrosine-protein kinase
MKDHSSTTGRGLDLVEFLRVIWRWKFVVIAVVAIVLAAAYSVLRVVTPLYESSTKLVISPVNGDPDPFLFGNIDAISPVYADAAKSRTTVQQAEQRIGSPIDRLDVEAFEGTPLLQIKVRDESPAVAQQAAQAVTDVLQQRVDSGDIGVESLKLSVLDHANLPEEAVYPRDRLSLFVAGLLGLALGIGVAFLGEMLRAKVDTVDAIEELTGVPCWAEIPNEPVVSRVLLPEVLGTDPRLRRLREALRDLRTSLQLGDDGSASIVITSPDGHHGKSTVATGLATTIAQSGRRTVLVDADLRRGRVSEIVGLPPTTGLMEALTGAPIEELIRSTGVHDLDVLTRGGLIDDPVDLLRGFPAVLRQLRERYDVVIVDTTPVSPVNDARVIASYADTVILVVSAENATRRRLKAALGRLSLLSIRPAGFVLNRSRTRSGSDYYASVPERDVSGLRRSTPA